MAHCPITNGLVPTISISLGTFEPGSGCNPVRYGCQTVRHQVCNRTVAYSNCLDTGMQLVATPLPSNFRHPTVPTSSLYNLGGPSTTGLDFHSSYTKSHRLDIRVLPHSSALSVHQVSEYPEYSPKDSQQHRRLQDYKYHRHHRPRRTIRRPATSRLV